MTVDLPPVPPAVPREPAPPADPQVATPDAGAAGPQPARLPSRSRSRAGDFRTCPRLYRFRSIDRIPERPSPDQARGTLVHAVLEALFDLPAQERTPQRAGDLVEPQWQRLVEQEPELTEVLTAAGSAEQFLASARALL